MIYGMDFGETRYIHQESDTESLPHSCRSRDSFDSNAEGKWLRRLAAGRRGMDTAPYD